MIKRYYSSYTGKQIDEAVKTIVENQIGLEDLSPELVAEIKSWVATGEGGEEVRELVFKSRGDFPTPGNPLMLYVATDEDSVYYWSTTGAYKVLTSSTPDVIVNQITKIEGDVQALQSQINNANILISGNAVKITSNEEKIASNSLSIQNLTKELENKADISVVNGLNTNLAELRDLVGVRKEGETRDVFTILAAQAGVLEAQNTILSSLDAKVNSNTTLLSELSIKVPTIESNIEKNTLSIVELTNKIPTIETDIQGLNSKNLQFEENLAALFEISNGKVDKKEGYDLVSLENIAKLERLSEDVTGLIKSVSKEFVISNDGELSIDMIEKSQVRGLEEALAGIEGLHGLQINGNDVIVSENKKVNISFDEKNFTYANNMVSLKPISLSDITNAEEGEEIVLNGGNA